MSYHDFAAPSAAPTQAAPATQPQIQSPMYSFRKLRDVKPGAKNKFGVAIQEEVPTGTTLQGVPVTRKNKTTVPTNCRVFYTGKGYSLAAIIGPDGMTDFERDQGQSAPAQNAQPQPAPQPQTQTQHSAYSAT